MDASSPLPGAPGSPGSPHLHALPNLPLHARAAQGKPLKPPNLLLLLLEGRAPWEAAASLVASPWLARLPKGDGHPVLVFPGLGAADLSTLPLRRFLRHSGYAPHAWGQGLNFGPRAGVLEACRKLVRDVVQRSGRPASLVGWSLGGIYARELAKEMPELTRCVVTLGAPFAGHPKATNAYRFFKLVNGNPPDSDDRLLAQIRSAPPVPTTSIFSKSDGIVAWPCSVNEAGEAGARTENIEIAASHIGMGLNPLALYALADRLRQDPNHWQPFHAQGARRWFFKTTT